MTGLNRRQPTTSTSTTEFEAVAIPMDTCTDVRRRQNAALGIHTPRHVYNYTNYDHTTQMPNVALDNAFNALGAMDEVPRPHSYSHAGDVVHPRNRTPITTDTFSSRASFVQTRPVDGQDNSDTGSYYAPGYDGDSSEAEYSNYAGSTSTTGPHSRKPRTSVHRHSERQHSAPYATSWQSDDKGWQQQNDVRDTESNHSWTREDHTGYHSINRRTAYSDTSSMDGHSDAGTSDWDKVSYNDTMATASQSTTVRGVETNSQQIPDYLGRWWSQTVPEDDAESRDSSWYQPSVTDQQTTSNWTARGSSQFHREWE